jgi:hypothetical protein
MCEDDDRNPHLLSLLQQAFPGAFQILLSAVASRELSEQHEELLMGAFTASPAHLVCDDALPWHTKWLSGSLDD